MYMFTFEGMLEKHITNENAKRLIEHEQPNNPYRYVFEALLLGKNISSLEAINDVATYLSKLTEKEIMEVTMKDVTKNIGSFYDDSGYLV